MKIVTSALDPDDKEIAEIRAKLNFYIQSAKFHRGLANALKKTTLPQNLIEAEIHLDAEKTYLGYSKTVAAKLKLRLLEQANKKQSSFSIFLRQQICLN